MMLHAWTLRSPPASLSAYVSCVLKQALTPRVLRLPLPAKFGGPKTFVAEDPFKEYLDEQAHIRVFDFQLFWCALYLLYWYKSACLLVHQYKY
jgi:hypothetical protein